MKTHDLASNSPEAAAPQEDDQQSGMDFEKTLLLGEQITCVMGSIVDLARAELLLALQTLPKLMMLWLMMMPIALLSWCSLSVLFAWFVYAASAQIGLGVLVFSLLQVLLLLICRWLFVRYRTRMTLPYTRAQVDDFVRSVKNELSSQSRTKE